MFFAFLFLLLWFDMVSKAKKQKKTAVVFVFFEILVDSMYAKKAKNPRFLVFCFYCYGLIRFQKQKTLEFFVFLRYWLVACMQKKKLNVFFCF